MRVGALPQFPTGQLKYNLTWSTDGLINEYCNPCEAIQDGKVREVLPLEGYEHFSLDGIRYEAFNTSGGTGSSRASQQRSRLWQLTPGSLSTGAAPTGSRALTGLGTS